MHETRLTKTKENAQHKLINPLALDKPAIFSFQDTICNPDGAISQGGLISG